MKLTAEKWFYWGFFCTNACFASFGKSLVVATHIAACHKAVMTD